MGCSWRGHLREVTFERIGSHPQLGRNLGGGAASTDLHLVGPMLPSGAGGVLDDGPGGNDPPITHNCVSWSVSCPLGSGIMRALRACPGRRGAPPGSRTWRCCRCCCSAPP